MRHVTRFPHEFVPFRRQDYLEQLALAMGDEDPTVERRNLAPVDICLIWVKVKNIL